MRLFFLLMLAVVSVAAFSGCAETQSVDNYQVMFRGLPNIYDTAVYAGGVRIGEIVSTETGAANAVKVAISIDGEFISMMTANTVFYVSAGRLNRATVDAYGAPLGIKTPILGFPSKWSLHMFKLKTLLARSADAAAQEADRINQLSGYDE